MNTEVGINIVVAIDLLEKGELVVIPTETVYGLAADCTNKNAIKKIFEVKQRPTNNPLILHVDSIVNIQPYVDEFPEIFQKLAADFCPGPLTFLMKKSPKVNDLITSGLDRVAVRIPNHPLTLKLIQELGVPLVAPSANLYGKLSPTKTEHVMSQLKGKIPYILEGGECQRGIESTIIGLEQNEVVIYRLGSVSPEDLEKTLGYLPGLKIHSENLPVASGMVKYHYAPSTPCSFFNLSIEPQANDAFLFFENQPVNLKNNNVRVLSGTGNLDEAARKLYSTLHALDQEGHNHIYIEKLPDVGIGKAINDRLNRAVAKFNGK